MLSEFSNAHVDLGQERSPDRGEIVALVKGLCLKSGNFVEPKARPEDFVGRGATVWLVRDFSFPHASALCRSLGDRCYQSAMALS